MSPVLILGVVGSNEADLPQVMEAGNDFDETFWVVDEVTEREHDAFDQLALAADELPSRVHQLPCAAGLEEDLVVLKVEPSLGTGLHGAEGLLVVLSCTDGTSLLADLEECRSVTERVKSAAVVVALMLVIPSPSQSDGLGVVLEGHMPDLVAHLTRKLRETEESCIGSSSVTTATTKRWNLYWGDLQSP